MTIRYEIGEGKIRELLRDQSKTVTFHLENPFTLEVKLRNVIVHRRRLALPLNSNQGKTRIARKSSWIEYTAPIMRTQDLSKRSDSVFSAHVNFR